MGLFKAIIDSIFGEVDLAGGRAVTRLTSAVSDSDTTFNVESTLRFGEMEDGAGNARFLINGEIVEAAGRTSSSPFTFTGAARGVDGTNAVAHPAGSLVLDIAENRTAIDLVRRGFLVDYAIGPDLDIIGRNLGLHKCPSMDEDTWRRVIKAVAYLPKQTIDAFDKALEALQGNTTSYEIFERLVSDPYRVFVEIESALASGAAEIRGRFVLTGGHPELTDGLTQVSVTFGGSPVQLRTVGGVFLDTTPARRGLRDGLTNYLSSFTAGTNVINLSPSPGAIGTAMLIDFTAYGSDPSISYHYMADDETIQDDQDRYAYLSDPLLAARCLLGQIRPTGTAVEVSTKL